MDRRVTRLVVPMAATAAVLGAGTAARAGGDPQWSRVPQATPCPADVRTPVSAIPEASPSAGENAPSLRLALTARASREAGNDLVVYRISASPASTPLRGITVIARLTCVPGDAALARLPSATTGRVTTGPRAVTWRFDLGSAPATATFAIRVRTDARGGPLVGEIATTGPVSNCPALQDADTPIEAHCRVTVPLPLPAAGLAPPVSRPARPAPVHRGPVSRPLPARPGVPPIVSPKLRGRPTVPPAAPAPAAPPVTRPPAAGALPVVPPAGPVPSGTPTPSALSQVNRAPVVPTAAPAPGAASQQADPPGTVLQSSDSHGDLGGRVLAFLIGGAAFLLTAMALVGGLIGARLRRRKEEEPEKEEDETSLNVRPLPLPPGVDPGTRTPTPVRIDPRLQMPRSNVSTNPPRGVVDVVRRTSEAGDPHAFTDQAVGRSEVDE
ncbi:hypothetical protein [Actinomadura sp. DC4]|uniref:hypothetical protein n=1 Tax=Actinomadura sp. DC4 TaxID=3055069 RepID=UPI0025B17804|nr:hypothetical protein [Actinomadura sp. DC4]MDN3351961.1 hypothetical protein [Actinomadura sp. DC4]